MRKFPIWLTICVIPALALLVGLGVWQVQRLQWKEGLIAEIASRSQDQPRPLAEVSGYHNDLSREWTRIVVQCAPPKPGDKAGLVYTLRNGQIAWRLLSICRFGPNEGIIVDRGFVDALDGELTPSSVVGPPLGEVVGLLRATTSPGSAGEPIQGGLRFAERGRSSIGQLLASHRGELISTGVYLYVAAQSETPSPSGMTAEAAPADLPNNHLGYAVTWFGLALALVGVYVALLFRRLRA